MGPADVSTPKRESIRDEDVIDDDVDEDPVVDNKGLDAAPNRPEEDVLRVDHTPGQCQVVDDHSSADSFDKAATMHIVEQEHQKYRELYAAGHPHPILQLLVTGAYRLFNHQDDS